MTKSLTNAESWAPKALCWHYCSALFEAQRVQVLVPDGASRELVVTWAVGVLYDGDWEALGVWAGAGVGVGVGPAFWRDVWEDFDSRGVDKISLVSAADIDARALCPAVKLLPPFRQILGLGYVPTTSSVGELRAEARRVVREASGVRAARLALERLLAASGTCSASVLSPDWPAVLEQFRPFYALRPHRRALVCEGDRRLEQVGGMLARAVRRHGPFADIGAAVSFVAGTLARSEARIDLAELPPLPLPSHPVGRAVARAAVQAALAAQAVSPV